MNTFTIPELQNQITQIEYEKQTIVDLFRNTKFMDIGTKRFFCGQATADYNNRIGAMTALIHEMEGKK